MDSSDFYKRFIHYIWGGSEMNIITSNPISINYTIDEDKENTLLLIVFATFGVIGYLCKFYQAVSNAVSLANFFTKFLYSTILIIVWFFITIFISKLIIRVFFPYGNIIKVKHKDYLLEINLLDNKKIIDLSNIVNHDKETKEIFRNRLIGIKENIQNNFYYSYKPSIFGICTLCVSIGMSLSLQILKYKNFEEAKELVQLSQYIIGFIFILIVIQIMLFWLNYCERKKLKNIITIISYI
ncbi:MAG: hypothetical protein ACRCVJ_13090 [Clostridium sp.]|uniref:hypothetical protein n=1 Tax=Clostridium sp. TaxID=1506 RepID=UPI003F41711E